MKRGGSILKNILTPAAKVLSSVPIGTVINSAIDALPVELHIPGGYQFCGPGTNLKKRLARGDPGINELDRACKEHDIAYSKYSDTANRRIADQTLAEKAWNRVTSSNANLGERAAALLVASTMKGKSIIGGGGKCRCQGRGRRKQPKSGAGVKKRKTTNKNGRGINKRKRSSKKSKKKNPYQIPSTWSMVKSGQGLYLRPYPRA